MSDDYSEIAEQQAADALAQHRIEAARQAGEEAERVRQEAEQLRRQRG
ncbi:hypothetical protein ACF1DV_37580 [Streptomyces achromogenes]